MIRDIKEFMRAKKYNEAVRLSRDLIKLALEGLNYYQNYDRVFLNLVVTLGFLGWIFCIVLQIIEEHSEVMKEASKLRKEGCDPVVKISFVDSTSCVFAVLVILLLSIQKAPWMYYSYCLMPLVFWNRIGKSYSRKKFYV